MGRRETGLCESSASASFKTSVYAYLEDLVRVVCALVALAALLGIVAFAGCNEQDGDSNGKNQPPFSFSIDFDDYPLGMIGDPWTISSQNGSSGAEVVLTQDAQNIKVLKLAGELGTEDYLLADYLFEPVSGDTRFEFQVMCEPEAAFGFWIYQHSTELLPDEIEIVGNPDGTIHAHDFGDGTNVVCGTTPVDTWVTVSIFVAYDDGLYDVLIDNHSTECSGLALRFQERVPLGGIGIFDASNLGYGGNVFFDNFLGEAL
jgi:hypothetical protein